MPDNSISTAETRMESDPRLHGAHFDLTPVSQDLYAQAEELNLEIPAIEVSRKLQNRLARTDRTLEIDESALWNGAQDIELENRILMKLDSLPKNYKNSDSIPKLITNNQMLLRIDPNPKSEKGLEKKLNTAFWLGVLVTDEFAEGNGPKYTDMERFSGSRLDGLSFAGFGVSAAGGATRLVYDVFADIASSNLYRDAFDGSDYVPFGIGLGVSLGCKAYGTAKDMYRESKDYDFTIGAIQKVHLKKARELGKKNQVLNYSDTLHLS